MYPHQYYSPMAAKTLALAFRTEGRAGCLSSVTLRQGIHSIDQFSVQGLGMVARALSEKSNVQSFQSGASMHDRHKMMTALSKRVTQIYEEATAVHSSSQCQFHATESQRPLDSQNESQLCFNEQDLSLLCNAFCKFSSLEPLFWYTVLRFLTLDVHDFGSFFKPQGFALVLNSLGRKSEEFEKLNLKNRDRSIALNLTPALS